MRDSTYATVEALLATGLPVWLSFRRCRHGVCGVYGQHWGGPEGDAFGRAARRFEELGVGALLVNCIPPDHVDGHRAVAARLHRPAARRLPEPRLPVRRRLALRGPASAARSSPRWRCAGARRARRSSAAAAASGRSTSRAARRALEGTLPGDGRRARPASRSPPARRAGTRRARALDRRARARPLPAPVPRPDLRARRVRADAGQLPRLAPPVPRRHRRAASAASTSAAGTGLLTVQLALNGADARARDRPRRARGREHAHERVPQRRRRPRHRRARSTSTRGCPRSATTWSSRASTRLPVDPFEQVTTHRPLDYWGRNLIDHLIAKLPDALADDGVAYVMQLSIIGQERTAEQLEERGFAARVVDFGVLRVQRRCSRTSGSRSSASSSCPTRTTSRSTATT